MGKRYFGNVSNCFFYMVLLLSIGCFSAPEKAVIQIQPGQYYNGSAKIGVKDSIITGLVDASIGLQGESVCQFYFDGKITGKTFPMNYCNFIDTGTISGTATILNDTTLLLKTNENPGCSEMIADITGEGLKIIMFKKEHFKQIRVVKNEKVFFYNSPDTLHKRGAYLVNGDEAIVTESQGLWLKVTYKKTCGWMLEKEMYPLH